MELINAVKISIQQTIYIFSFYLFEFKIENYYF